MVDRKFESFDMKKDVPSKRKIERERERKRGREREREGRREEREASNVLVHNNNGRFTLLSEHHI